jgi:tripartite-type tricarboxylate transporter receptor subunit TctC
MNRYLVAMAIPAFALLVTEASAQPYPSRPIRMVLPFGVGGLVDVPGRIIGNKLSESMGQPVVIENRSGAGGTIGSDLVAKSKPDGYTMMITSPTHVISANLYKNLPYDALKDFTSIAKIAEGPYVLAVNPSLPVKSVRDLIALAKAEPGKIDYASSGNGSTQHLVGALFASMAGAPINHVPYKDSSRATQDIVGGQVKVGFMGTPNAIPHMKSGRLRALAVTTAVRSPEMPDVPTLNEAGVPGYEATIWVALMGPAAMPRDLVSRINSEINRLLTAPDVKPAIAATGLEVSTGTPGDLDKLVRLEFDKWGKVIRETGATVQ